MLLRDPFLDHYVLFVIVEESSINFNVDDRTVCADCISWCSVIE